MNRIFIKSVGVIAPEIDNEKKIWKNLSEENYNLKNKRATIPKFIQSNQSRRMDRISLLSYYASKYAYDQLNTDGLNVEKIGTVFNTCFGPINTVLQFSEHVVEKRPDVISPTKFSHTVNNACLGHTAKGLRLKGPSNMLINSNYIHYAMMLLNNKKANLIITTGADEYCSGVDEFFRKKDVDIVESACSIVLGSTHDETDYCEVLSCQEENLHEHPYFSKNINDFTDKVKRVIQHALDEADITAHEVSGIVTAGVKGNNESSEDRAINEIFEDIDKINIRNIIGDCLGAHLGINLMTAAMCIKENRLPKGNQKVNDEIKYMLVNNYTLSGAFTSYILAKV